jgi:ferredoxin
MTTNSGGGLFQAFLIDHDEHDWRDVVQKLLPRIHEVDRDATEIWFYVYPLALLRVLEGGDQNELIPRLRLQGSFYLKDQIDSSHWFLYGHRFWPEVKASICDHADSAAGPTSLDLSTQIRELSAKTARLLNVEPSLLIGITAVGFMTLQQAGPEAFRADKPARVAAIRKSPAGLVRSRARDDSQGPFGFLRGDKKRFSVIFDERDKASSFPLIRTQHLTTAAANDKRDYHSREARCIVGEGPIPVECRSASCGTCWVGVLGGRTKLSKVLALERRRIKEFGYIDTDESHPLIRLSCQAQAFGNITIVIPPWNGLFGRQLQDERLESSEREESPEI